MMDFITKWWEDEDDEAPSFVDEADIIQNPKTGVQNTSIQ